MRSIWSGNISFGLVIVPVKLYSATEEKQIQFRQVHREDGGKVQFRRFCSLDGEEVPYSDIAKGYETPTGDMIILTEEDLDSLPLPTAKTISVLQFVPAGQINPAWYGKPYYVEPQDAGVKPYALLREAIGRGGHVALVKVALRSRESLAVIRVDGKLLVLQMISWPEEIREPAFPFTTQDIAVSDAETAMACQLIDAMTGDFTPGEYHSEYDEAMRLLVAAKLAGDQITPPAGLPAAAPAGDLAAVLQASLAALKPAGPETAAGQPPARRRAKTSKAA